MSRVGLSDISQSRDRSAPKNARGRVRRAERARRRHAEPRQAALETAKALD